VTWEKEKRIGLDWFGKLPAVLGFCVGHFSGRLIGLAAGPKR